MTCPPRFWPSVTSVPDGHADYSTHLEQSGKRSWSSRRNASSPPCAASAHGRHGLPPKA